MKKIRNVAIVGAGAIGGYYGGRLAEAGISVSFLLRSDYDYVREHGLRVKSIAGDFNLPKVKCAKSSKEIGVVDLVIVAWKTTSNSAYQPVISPLLHEETIILTLQNGLGNTERLAEIFGAHRIFGGLCFVCINRVGPGEIVHSAAGIVKVGEYQPDGSDRLKQLVAFLSQGGIDCREVRDLEAAQWTKLVWNIPFNGLAISEGGVDTEVLLSRPEMVARILRVMKEVQSVASALGFSISDEVLDQQIAVTRSMGAYRPSSMIDYVEGRAVEVDAIWREPLRRAHRIGVDVPEIERLLAEIEQRLEERGK